MASKTSKWVFITIAILVVIGLWVGAFVFLITRGAGSTSTQQFDEEVIEEGTAAKIAMVDIKGVITSAEAQPGSLMASDETVVAQLEQAIEDDDVKAVILDVDSPGGEVVASDNIHNQVLEAKKAGKAVVALMGATAASGGYYVSAPADEIVANSETLTGSIGVILTIFNLEGTAEKLGVKPTIIKSAPHKDIGSPFRGLSPDEVKIFEGLIAQSYSRFVSIVADGRQLSEQQVRKLADGRIYSGDQAKDLKLVDTLGDRDVAFERAKKLGKTTNPSLVRYKADFGLAGLFSSPFGFKNQSLVEKSGIDLRPGLKYLWII